MNNLDPHLAAFFRQIDAGERLQLMATRIGLALWAFQDVESCSALYFAMVAKLKKGIGVEASYAILREIQSKPFGATVDGLRKAGLLGPDLQASFDKIREERNWLVHRSLSESRSAVHNETEMERLLGRIEAMQQEARRLLRTIEKLVVTHAEKAGVSRSQVQQ